jgi:hypothetical protein
MRSQRRLFLRRYTTQINQGKGDHPIHSRRVLFILASGKVDLEMERVSKDGLMVLCTLESGEKIEHMAEVNLYMWTVIFMMGSGLMIKLMGMEFTSM